MRLGSPLNLNFLLFLRSLLPMLVSLLSLSDLNLLIQRREGSRKGKRWSRLEDLVQLVKTRLSEAWREQTLSLQSHRPSSQHPCSAVSHWKKMHHSRTSTGALGATLPQPWRRLCYFQRICSSYRISRRMRSSSIAKDIWAWYDVNPFFYLYLLYIYALFICYGINPFLLGCLSHFQAWKDNQFVLPTIGRWTKKTVGSCANT